MENIKNNPLLSGERVGKYEAIPFHLFKTEHFAPALEVALKEAYENVDKIRKNNDAPTFENTLLAMEDCSEKLDYVTTIYFNLMGMESDNEFKALAQEFGPKLSAFSSSITLDPVIFEKVKKLYENRNEVDYNSEQLRLLEKTYKSFVRNGANLNEEDKKKLLEINQEMSKLGPQFSNNVLNATNAFELHITDKKELVGIPESALEAAAYLAKQKGKEDGWLFNLQYPSILPILTYAENRELRKKINLAYGSRAFRDEFDNQEILKKIAKYRHQRAQLLGYKSHADYTLEERMAENPKTVFEFLDKIYDAAIERAREEVSELEEFAKKLDNIDKLEAWDASFYSEKMKKEKFDFDEEELRPYFKVENVVNGVFEVAKKMYDLDFVKVDKIPIYHEDVTTYEVYTKDQFVGLLYVDLHPRDTKRGGAWMTTFRGQGLQHGEVKRPHVAIVANLTPSTETKPALLRLNEVTTIFHEFGHALHALLSDCYFASLASPNVYWDFVELPSQIMENWVTEKEALKLFAKHYETGEIIPDELIEKVKNLRQFHAGMANIRQLSLGYLDMAWHSADPSNIEDVAKFEAEVSEKTRLYPENENKNTSTSFSHVFAGGYSSGYYSYKWAEVLEADAFEKFLEEGIFNKETAASFRDNILSKGNTKHPMDLYVAFRGRKPDTEALLRRDGLLK